MEKVSLTDYEIIIDFEIDNYDIYLNQINSENKIFVVTDENVFSLYHHHLQFKTNRNIIWYVIKPGDETKNYETYLEISKFLLSNDFKRNDILISFGGGVISDITGFVAATYLRGVNLVHIPTTLLAQIDSTVGGKTGINFEGYKNMIGSFYNPRLVLIETSYLKTLPIHEVTNGLGELIKIGFLGSENLLNLIENNPDCFYEPLVIKEAIEIKKDYVLKDYHDQGIRHALNLGHTFGHAIEAAFNFEVTHGHAVLLGMLKAFEVGMKLKITTKDLYQRLHNLIEAINFEVIEISFDKYHKYMVKDKKSFKEGVLIVLLEDIGKAVITPISWDELYELAN